MRSSGFNLISTPEKTLTSEELLVILDVFNRDKVHPSCNLVDLQVLPRCHLFDVLLQHKVINNCASALVVRWLQSDKFTANGVAALLLNKANYLRRALYERAAQQQVLFFREYILSFQQ